MLHLINEGVFPEPGGGYGIGLGGRATEQEMVCLGSLKRGAGSLEDTLLDRLPDRSSPSSILDVFHFVEAKLDPDRFASMAYLKVLHDTRQIGNMSQSRQLELQTNSRS